jgi:hypothetical protein
MRKRASKWNKRKLSLRQRISKIRAPTSQNHNLRICLMYKPSLLARVRKNYHASCPFCKYHPTDLGAKNNVCSQIKPADFFQYNSDPLTYRVYRISLDKEPVPCQLIPFSIMLKFQININEDGII